MELDKGLGGGETLSAHAHPPIQANIYTDPPSKPKVLMYGCASIVIIIQDRLNIFKVMSEFLVPFALNVINKYRTYTLTLEW